MWNIEKERKRECGRQASTQGEKKGDRELEREIKNEGVIFCWKNNMNIVTGVKMRNASGHQGENERQWKKSEQEHARQFLHKTCN